MGGGWTRSQLWLYTLIFLATLCFIVSAASENEENKSKRVKHQPRRKSLRNPLNDSDFFWIQRDSVSFRGKRQKAINRKLLKQLVNQRRRKALRRHRRPSLTNRITSDDLGT
jgi:hypothetical protein